MRSFTPKMLGTLAEALSVYGRVIRQNLGVLLGLFFCQEALFVLVWYALTQTDLTMREVSRFSGYFANLMSLTFGALAIVRAVSAADRECAAWTDGEPVPDRVLTRWGRLAGTEILLGLCGSGIAIALTLALLLAGRAVGSPFAGLGGAAYGLGLLLGLACAALAVGLAVWLFVGCLLRWSFAPVLSVICPVAGTTAFRMSAEFTRGRRGRCLLFLGLTAVVAGGLGALPGCVRQVLLFEPKPGLGACLAVLCTAVLQDLSALFALVAMLVFGRRAVDGTEAAHDAGYGRRSSVVLSLLALGLGYLVFSACHTYQVLKAQHEEDRARQQLMVEKLLKELREKPSAPASEASRVAELPADYPFVEQLRAPDEGSDGRFRIDSPLDLRLGSTAYAQQLGERIHKYGDPASYSAEIRLSEPWHGLTRGWLLLNGANKALTSASFSGSGFGENYEPHMTLADARQKVDEICGALEQRLGVRMRVVTPAMSDEDALREIERFAKHSQGSVAYATDIYLRTGWVRHADVVIEYGVRAAINNKRLGEVVLRIRRFR